MNRNVKWKFIKFSCLNEFSYCKTKHARGELGSYEISEIVERVKQSFEGIWQKKSLINLYYFNLQKKRELLKFG